MLDRYTSAEMAAIWSDDAKFHCWWAVETAVIAAYCDLGVFDPDVAQRVQDFVAADCCPA